MENIKLDDAKKYLKAIKSNKSKYLTCEILSKDIGIYPDIIANTLSFFDPLITMDMSYDLRNIQEQLNEFVKEKDTNRQNRRANKKPSKLVESKYKSVNEFVFSKYVVAGGLMDRSIELSSDDLKELKKVVMNELKLIKRRK